MLREIETHSFELLCLTAGELQKDLILDLIFEKKYISLLKFRCHDVLYNFSVILSLFVS